MERVALASICLSLGASVGCAVADEPTATTVQPDTTCPTPAELFPSATWGALDGRLLQMPCSDNPTTDDCDSGGAYYAQGNHISCSGSGLTVQHDFPVGGAAGQPYFVTMHFYGILEPRNYGAGVTRDALNSSPGNQGTGANPTPWGYANQPQTFVVPQSSTYNTYEIQVFNNLGTQDANRIGFYFLNSDIAEWHKTYVINFEKPIVVIGGGTVRLRTRDSNCRQIKNCGLGGFPCAGKARTVDISAAYPQPPVGTPPTGGLLQPGLGQPIDHSGQWLLIDVTSVTCLLGPRRPPG
jgi:hypothetical protein